MPATWMFAAWLAKATALLMLAMGVTIGLRRAPAGARYVVWLATLVALLLVPAISAWSPLALPILPSGGPMITGMTAERDGPTAITPIPSASHPAPAHGSENTERSALTVMDISTSTIVLLVWAAIGALLLSWLLLGALAVRRIVRGARVLGDETWLSPMYDVADRLDLEHAPRLVMSSAIEMPFACGILRPTIVLPSSAEQWSDERRRCVLFHELAHVRRSDLLGHTVGRIVCVLYWFHPLVWSAAKRLRAESERACDDLVLACGGARASDYANHLLEIVTAVRLYGAPATALPMADKREFEGRMLAILDPAVKRTSPSRAQTLMLTLGIGALALTIAAAAPSRRTRSTAIPVPQITGKRSNQLEQTPAADSSLSKPTELVTRERRTNNTLTVGRSDSAVATEVQETNVGAGRQAPTHLPDPQDPRKGQPIDTALLGKVLRTDRDAGVRKSAAWVLQGRRDGIPLLLDRLRSDESDAVREMSAWALAGMGGSSVEIPTALAQALKSDKSDEVRATAAWGLGRMNGRADVTALEEGLTDLSPEVRQRALWALGQQQLPAAPARVVALLRDEHDEVRLMAAWVLGQILDRSTIPALRDAFLKERDSETLQAEFRALLFMGDRSQAVIDRAMTHEDPELRARGVRMIAGQGPGVWPWPWPWPDPRPEP